MADGGSLGRVDADYQLGSNELRFRPTSAPLRQRGFYSEVLDAGARERLVPEAVAGPRVKKLQPRLAVPKQRVPHVRQFDSDKSLYDASKAASKRRARLNLGSQDTSKLHPSVPPPKAMEPKVMVAFDQPAGVAPRRLLVERTKRLYAEQDLVKLLEAAGVDTAEPELNGNLPLDLFDNTEFESRPPEEWMALAVDSAGQKRYLPAKYLKRDEHGKGSWRSCQVLSYDAQRRLFAVREESVAENQVETARKKAAAAARVAAASGVRMRSGSLAKARGGVRGDGRAGATGAGRGATEGGANNAGSDDEGGDGSRTGSLMSTPRPFSAPSSCTAAAAAAVTAVDAYTAGTSADAPAADAPLPIEHVPRIDVCFAAEDPFLFAKRVAAAQAARAEAAARLRFELHAACVPMDGLPQLEAARTDRMADLALSSASIAGNRQACVELLKEVEIDYAMCLSRILLERLTKQQEGDPESIFSEYPLPPPPPPRAVPESAVVVLPPRDKRASAHGFAFHTFFSKPEIIGGILKVRAECNKVVSMSLFNLSLTKAHSADEFDLMQAQALAQTSNYLRDSWNPTLKAAVKNSLQKVGKGWFNAAETVREVYNESKLRRLLRMFTCMMQDSLISLANDSLRAFADLVVSQCSVDVRVRSASRVDLTPRLNQGGGAAQPPGALSLPPSLFSLELVVIEGEKIQYRTSPNEVMAMAVRVFERAIAAVQGLPQLERSVMESLFWSETPMLDTVTASEGEPKAELERLKAAMRTALPPAEAYLRLYEAYGEVVKVDMEQFVTEYEEKQLDRTSMAMDARQHLDMAEDAEAQVPLSISIGVFYVNCSAVRKFLVERHTAMAIAILTMSAARVRAKGDKLNRSFVNIKNELRRPIGCVENVVEIEEYIANLPNELGVLQESLADMMAERQMLDTFEFPLSDDDFAAFWKTLAWPRAIEEEVRKVEEACEWHRNDFEAKMRAEQEHFAKVLYRLEVIVAGFGKHTDLSKVKEVAAEVERLKAELTDAEDKRDLYNRREVIFGVETTDYSKLSAIVKQFEPYASLWTTAAKWRAWEQEWLYGDFCALSPELMDVALQNATRTMHKLVKTFAGVEGLEQASKTIKAELVAFAPVMPLVTALRNPGMRTRHWQALTDETGKNLNKASLPEFTLVDLMELNLGDQLDIVNKVCDTAGKEFSIEQSLDKMLIEWKGAKLSVVPYKDTLTFILKSADAIQQLLDDHIVMTQTMTFSPFKGPFAQRIDEWEAQLRLVSETFDEWLGCQRQWMYLEPVFSSEDIMRQLPTEAKRFASVDRTWRKLMAAASNESDPLVFCKPPRILQSFKECNSMLELVQKGLAEYLETKRIAFSRFYFLSNDELLEILSQAKDPLAVQPHLKKCFENIDKIQFEDDLAMTAMVSGEGEVVPFTQPLMPRGGVENWMNEVLEEMKRTVSSQIVAACAAYKEPERSQWVLAWPGASLIAGSSIFWALNVEKALRTKGNKGIAAYFEVVHGQLLQLTEIVTGRISKLQRKSLGALITIDVHQRDVTGNMRDSGVSNTADFEWISQLRYELCAGEAGSNYAKGDTLVKQLDGVFKYGNEYLGNTMRLVITPLTDRIYLTLTGALQLFLGGAPAGPAGTGKTETTKDLAKALAKQCVVFNCQEGLDFIAMGKFFRGLAMSGAWACFDEFNRIDLEVLSVIAQQVSSIQQAMQSGAKRFDFEGCEIGLDATCAIFITMNPGYAGRSELPDNLKALFRPVACMVPDYALIAEIRLYSFGYRDARRLSQKMVKTFQLSSEQLSSQDHYDFGMRAVNTVIQAAGNNRQASPDMEEDLLVLSALADSNRPKFLAEDMLLFNSIMSDLFPGFAVPKPDYTDLINAIKAECESAMLVPTENFLFKCIQIYEVSVLRHGLMTVGPAGGGKTAARDMLTRAMTKLDGVNEKYSTVRQWILNPKAITMGQLYGEFDENTHEWTDGILCVLYRSAMNEFAQRHVTDRQWLVFDGPVDALWIESMNTVLDDNRKLCLVSGEIITMTPYMSMFFEVEDLAVASPATVSRVGTIFMEPEKVVGVAAQVEAWLMSQPELVQPHRERLSALLKPLLSTSVQFVRKSCREYVPTVDNNLVSSSLSVLKQFWSKFEVNTELAEGEEAVNPNDLLENVLEKLVVFAVTWGAGAATDAPSRDAFDSNLRFKVDELKIGDKVKLPQVGLVYDYAVDIRANSWVGWMDTVPESTLSPETPFQDIIVPTVDSVRYTWLLEQLVQQGTHVLALGPTGTGKTLTLQDKLLNGMPDEFSPIFIGFSAKTTANQTQDQIDSKMEKRRRGMYGPPASKRFVLMVDDLNMPQREEYGAQPPIEILRLWMGHGGWYDRKLMEFRTIVDTSMVGAMGQPGGGRQTVTDRFLRFFNFVSFPALEDKSMKRIFSKILRTFAEAYLAEELRSVVDPIVQASINLYKVLLEQLLPTPAKPHYTFNLRDIASIFQGLLSADPKATISRADLVRLWAHENLRVFRDRLVNDEDRSWFDEQIRGLVPSHFGLEWGDVVEVDISRLIYGDFLQQDGDSRAYSEIKDATRMVSQVEDYLDDYNSMTTKKMRLVMFVDAVGHVARISRVIRQPRGNALLLGVGGSGRQSLTRLAAFMATYDVFQIEITKSYGDKEWRDDLKRGLLLAGEQGKPLVFLFTDTQIVKESFLEDINNILNAGEVPTLFDDNDMTVILNSMRPLCQSAGVALSKVSLYSFFIKRVRSNIHMVLCMSPMGEAFRTRLRNFPSLVNNCTIDYFAEWPEEALRSVASSALGAVDFGDNGEAVKSAVVSMCGRIHVSVEKASKQYLEEQRRYNYVTPTSYLEVLTTFQALLASKRDEVSTAKRRLVTGLEKLQSTELEVDKLKRELEEMEPVLIQTSEQVEKMMGQIEKDKAEADETRAVVVKEEAVASTKAEECQQIKDSAEKDLAEALPALNSAVAVLRNLKLSDLSEVAKYANPPAGVKLVMEAMCVLKNIPPKKVGAAGSKVDDYWDPGKKMLSDAKGLLESMFSFDKDNIPEKVIQKIQPYIENPDFEPKKIESVSKACTAMCQWVRAMYKYHWVSKEVEPKRQALKAAEEELDVLTQSLNKLRAKLKDVMDKISMLESKFNQSVSKKEELARKVEDAQLKRDRAERLLGGLGGEKQRWVETVKTLTAQEGTLVGDVCIAAGAVAYVGPFSAEFRLSLLKTWRTQLASLELAFTPNASVSSVMADPVLVRKWQVDGLPADTVSTENGIILASARRWPLCVDPQGQANNWIKNSNASAGIEVVKPSDKEFIRTLENAVRFGTPVMMENILESLDPALDPILLKLTFVQGGNIVMKIGDNVIPYHQDFRFYLTTKLPNPHYAPETCVKLTILNFTITQEGLEDQLLGITVAKERPDLEASKNELVASNARMAAQLKDIESRILRLLSESTGNILDDEHLINTLAQSKVTSDEISVKAEQARVTEIEIDTTRNEYRPVARRAALLFFCVADMSGVDPMYQYSMPWFVNLFTRAIEDSEKSDDMAQRLETLLDFSTYLIYENICRSLFEAHKLLFSFTVTIRIMQAKGEVNADEYRFFLSGSAGAKREETKRPDAPWITAAVWNAVTSLSTLPKFEGLDKSVAQKLSLWRAYFDSSDTHKERIPGSWQAELDPLQRLCVLRCFRPDKVVPGMQMLVTHYIGARYIEAPPFNLATSFRDASNLLPIVFVLSAGADPYDSLLKFANEMRFSKKLVAISLGQGQGPIAERLMSQAMERGTWVLLQNCHLASSWMPKLEAFVEQYNPDQMHRDYRLWLTSMPSDKFPVLILQNSVKMTIEPPRGVKMNLLGSYNNFTDTYLDSHPKRKEFKKLLYGLCCFHALLQDRRKFGALGFNICYEFTTGDLKCCILQLETFLARYDKVPYKVLVNLFGHINYGGRITDDWDRRMVMTLLRGIINEGIMDDEFQIAPGREYYSPPPGTVAQYVNVIMTMPLSPHPNIFGLHENADITCAQNETNELCEIMMSLQPKAAGGGGRNREDVIEEVALELQARALRPFPVGEISVAYPLLYEESMNTVLSQECIRYNKLIDVFSSSLAALLKALKGLVVMSAELEAMADALYANQVPSTWAKAAYPSLKALGGWMDDLVQRIAFVQRWVNDGPPPVFWISGFFFPQAFLTGTLQNYARKYSLAIDTVSFDFEILHEKAAVSKKRPDDGCYIHGLFLEGASWNHVGRTLVEAKPKELYVAFPAIWLNPKVDRPPPTAGVYSCPVYKTLTRAGTLSTTGHSTNFVLMVELPSEEECSGVFSRYCETFSSHWIKRAVALFCALNY